MISVIFDLDDAGDWAGQGIYPRRHQRIDPGPYRSFLPQRPRSFTQSARRKAVRSLRPPYFWPREKEYFLPQRSRRIIFLPANRRKERENLTESFLESTSFPASQAQNSSYSAKNSAPFAPACRQSGLNSVCFTLSTGSAPGPHF